MKKQAVVIGLGRFGSSLAETLASTGYDVLAIDNDEDRVRAIASKVTQAVEGDATDESVLKEADIPSLDVGIVAIGSDIQSSVLAAILLKKLGIPYLIARAENDLHGSILEKIGADQVVYPEREMGYQLAHTATLRNVRDYIPILQNYGVAKLNAPPHFVGNSLANLGFGRRGKFGIVALVILRGQDIIITPADTEILHAGDVLITTGSDDRLEELLSPDSVKAQA
jgi:trk system potassium uptake protein TrkA